jgi:hypothetical protein
LELLPVHSKKKDERFAYSRGLLVEIPPRARKELAVKHFGTSALLAATPIVVACFLCTSVDARTEQYRTYVEPTPAETMQRPCEYELTLRDASKPVKAVFVVIERGWQVGNLYFDPDVAAFAERFDLALVLARHCRAKTEDDMDIIPEHGIGRALLEALNQFARQSRHPELADSKIILFSFSERSPSLSSS